MRGGMVGENGLLADLVATAHFGLRGRNAAAAKSKLLSMTGPGLSSDGLGYKTEIAELTNIARQSIVGCEAQGRGDFAGLGFQALWPSPNCPTSAVRGRRSVRQHAMAWVRWKTPPSHATQRSDQQHSPLPTPWAAVTHLLSMASDRYFTSQEPLAGDPPLLWDDFRHPRLRRFPQPVEDLVLGRYLGCGIDGLVFKARLRGQREPLAVKIVIETSIALA